jgi:hypothetical protein
MSRPGCRRRRNPAGSVSRGSVYDQIRNKLSLSFRSLGEQSFKNIPQPVRTFSITESAETGALPSPHRWRKGVHLLKWLAVPALVAIAAGYWFYPRVPLATRNGLYAGPICYGPTRIEPARCYRAQGILNAGKLTGQWHGRPPVATVFLSGEVADSGGADIRLHADDADGARVADMTLAGALRDGHLYASGTVEPEHKITRTVTLDWQRQ